MSWKSDNYHTIHGSSPRMFDPRHIETLRRRNRWLAQLKEGVDVFGHHLYLEWVSCLSTILFRCGQCGESISFSPGAHRDHEPPYQIVVQGECTCPKCGTEYELTGRNGHILKIWNPENE